MKNARLPVIFMLLISISGCLFNPYKVERLPQLTLESVTPSSEQIVLGQELILDIKLAITGDLIKPYDVVVVTRFYNDQQQKIAEKRDQLNILEASSKNMTQSFRIPKSALIGKYYYEVEAQLIGDRDSVKSAFTLTDK